MLPKTVLIYTWWKKILINVDNNNRFEKILKTYATVNE